MEQSTLHTEGCTGLKEAVSDIADLKSCVLELQVTSSAETISRTNADNNLTQALTTEMQARELADIDLQNAVKHVQDSLRDEVLNRGESVSLLREEITDWMQTNGDNSEELQSKVTAIEHKIPLAASAANQLADKDFVNSSISTATAEFIGTFNSLSDLQATTKAFDNNDYAFVVGKDSNGNTQYTRYKWNGSAWIFEYILNNSSFTSEQWKAINSGITENWMSSHTHSYTDLSNTPTIAAKAGSSINSVGTPSVAASTSGATTTFTFNFLKGAKGDTGPTGAQGPKGDTGPTGEDGARGSKWFTGTALTHTTGTQSGTSTMTDEYRVNDMYLNSSTGRVYNCTAAGTETASKWDFSGSIKGATGANGSNGTTPSLKGYVKGSVSGTTLTLTITS